MVSVELLVLALRFKVAPLLIVVVPITIRFWELVSKLLEIIKAPPRESGLLRIFTAPLTVRLPNRTAASIVLLAPLVVRVLLIEPVKLPESATSPEAAIREPL